MAFNSRYYLVNSRGERRELVDLIEHPRNEYMIDWKTIRYGDDADFELNQEGLRFTPYDIDLIFKFGNYNLVDMGVSFIDLNQEMTLQKEIVSTGITYSKRVVIKKVMQKPVMLIELYEATATVTALSEWFTTEVVRTISGNAPDTYPLQYPIRYGEGNVGVAVISNDFHRRIAIELEIRGLSVNPRYTITNSAGVVTMEGQINTTVPANNILVISPRRARVYLADMGLNELSNQYQNQDFSKDTFLYMEDRDTYTIRVFQDNTEDAQATVRFLQTRVVV